MPDLRSAFEEEARAYLDALDADMEIHDFTTDDLARRLGNTLAAVYARGVLDGREQAARVAESFCAGAGGASRDQGIRRDAGRSIAAAIRAEGSAT